MKKVFLLFCLAANSSCFGQYAYNAPKAKNSVPTSSASESPSCTVILEPYDCIKGKSFVDCYYTSLNGGNKYRIMLMVTGMNNDGFQIGYGKMGEAGISYINKTFYSKQEVISNFVHTIYGDACNFAYK